jgi:hypothetical protein
MLLVQAPSSISAKNEAKVSKVWKITKNTFINVSASIWSTSFQFKKITNQVCIRMCFYCVLVHLLLWIVVDFEVLTAVTVTSTIFWHVIQCEL